MDILRERVNVRRRNKMIIRFASLTCSVLLICQSAFADEPAYKRHRYRHYVTAAPHVVELVARLTAGGLSSTAFATMVSPLLVCAGSPANLSGLSRAAGSAIATAPRFTMCRRAPRAKHRVEAARGGEGALTGVFASRGMRPLSVRHLQLLAKLQAVH
jgi:hypothetical protein